MRLLIDATPLLLRSAGVKTYVYHWIRHLEKSRGTHRIGLFPLLRELGECDHERSAASPLRTAAGIALLQSGNYLGGPVLGWLGRRADIFHHSSQQLRRPPARLPDYRHPLRHDVLAGAGDALARQRAR